MQTKRHYFRNFGYWFFFLLGALLLGLLLQTGLNIQNVTPMLFTLAVFCIALTTRSYFWGISASLVSALIVNFAFSCPYFDFDFALPENLSSALVLMAVTCVAGTLTARIRQQELREAESAQEAARAKLLRAISHDLRTPLTTIYGSSSTILESADKLSSEKQMALVAEIRSEADWLIRMVENLLTVTRMDQSGVSLNKTPIAAEELVDAVLIQFRKRYPQQPVTVELPEEFICIPMDPLLIQQVLSNLLENAVQHAEGMRHLTLRVYPRGADAVFEVQDDGRGIPPQLLCKLFSSPVSTPTLSSDGHRSMGIGLSVCAAIIRAHGGEIQAENSPKGGALFRFTLKMEVGDHEQQ